MPYAIEDVSLRPIELACEQLHPVHCAERLRADSPNELIAIAMEHGARKHGFTPVWYTQGRRAAMAMAAMRHLG
jgi:hypothetical protein